VTAAGVPILLAEAAQTEEGES